MMMRRGLGVATGKRAVSFGAAAFGLALVAGSLSPALAVGEKGQAEIKGRDGKDLGTVAIFETTSGVLLKIKLKGLPPGPHGFHLHQIGKCSGDFASAGAVYNPLGAKHGFLNEEGPMAGDLPNLIAGANGEVEVDLMSPFVTLSKEAEETVFDADGTALVIFDKADDYVTDPEGNAGDRIGCGPLVQAKGQ
jgi:superoxide dismutase, Cu-Zn family